MGKDNALMAALAQTKMDASLLLGVWGLAGVSGLAESSGMPKLIWPLSLRILTNSEAILDNRVDEDQMDMVLFCQDFRNVATTVGEAECWMSSVEDDVSTQKQQVGWAFDLNSCPGGAGIGPESHACCNYLHIVGFLEGTEEPDTAKILEDWFCLWVPDSNLSPWCMVVVAYRSLGRHPPSAPRQSF
ncbi:hypothetical protein NDU88_004082 [Pleurodeles waltl]|uniref:Uncharacterized protein n=1 Tax=Pleurodeles waltl TaxID=8319 RepID=A0AAV7MSG7_PLEWA|nr:hypothetical protein NDU88_004082 [Pleurodeles waltl]